MLTADQRWLLWAVGLNISRALIDDAGLDHFMAGRRGGAGHRGGPEWLTSFDMKNGELQGGPLLGEVRVTVTRADIKRFRKTIPAELLGELKAIDKAQLDEHWHTEMWCFCGHDEAHTDFLGREHYHPSDAEVDEHYDRAGDLLDRERDCLLRILALEVEPVGQLELFEVAS